MSDETRFFVPGRIEVLGKHTDYAGGRSLLAATERGLTIGATATDEDTLRFRAAATGEEVVVGIAELLAMSGGEVSPRDRTRVGGTGPERSAPGSEPTGPARPGWARYAEVVARRIADHFGPRLRGARVEFGGDLPVAAGLSSSSALVTGLFLGLDAVCRFHDDPAFRQHLPDREHLAGYLAAVERGSPVPGLDGGGGGRPGAGAGPDTDGVGAPLRADPRRGPGSDRGVGVRGGSEDHTAILCAERGRVVRYAFEPVRRLGSVPLPGDWRFVVACSGVVAEKAAGARAPYNRLSDRAARAAAAWRAATGGTEPALGPALETAGDADTLVEAVRHGAARSPDPDDDPTTLANRARHFALEVALVDRAFRALERGDAAGFGDAVAESQRLAERLLGNQVPETVRLVATARELGALAASAFGAGFGGAVYAVVPAGSAAAFAAAWGRTAEGVFVTTAGGAAGRRLASGSQGGSPSARNRAR